MKRNLMIGSLAIGMSSILSLSALAMPNHTENYITREKAESIALQHAGLKETEVRFVRGNLDYDDGKAEYEIEFWKDSKEYDYEIDAVTGTILSYDYDIESYVIPVSHAKTSVQNVSTDKAASYITDAQAKTFALQHAGLKESDVQFVNSLLDYDDGRAQYEVEFWKDNKEYDYEIDAVSGAVLGYDYDIESYAIPSTQSAPSTTANGYIADSQAKSIALQHAGLKESAVSALRCKFDYDDGRAEYEVDFRQGGLEYEYTIDASTGTILEYDMDYDD